VAEQHTQAVSADRAPAALSDRLDLEWISVGKRSGLSLDELNMFRVRDLVAYSDIHAGRAPEGERAATQDDIDSFYG
jgi:hypothetical protein